MMLVMAMRWWYDDGKIRAMTAMIMMLMMKWRPDYDRNGL
jgi:hypothetical protein